MLKFINKKGKKVMEMEDNGQIKIKDEKLKEELKLQEGVVEEEEEEQEEK